MNGKSTEEKAHAETQNYQRKNFALFASFADFFRVGNGNHRPMSSLSKWQEIRRRQGITNAERWLNTLTSSPNPFQLVPQEYDNLLRAIEYALDSPANFDLAYRLIQTLHTYAIGYADWERWLIYLQKAHQQSQLAEKKYEEATLMDMMGYIHRSQGDFKKAETCLSQAVALYKQQSCMSDYAVSLSNLASVLESLGQDGLDVCQNALRIADRSHDEIARARVLLNLSSIYMRRREWQAGLQAAKRAYKLTSQPQHTVLNTRALFNMLSCLGNMEKWDEINATFAQLADDLTQRGDIHTLAKLRNNLGIIALNLHNLAEAEQQWHEALKLQSTIQDPAEMAYLYNNLGMVYTQMGELETAEELLQNAVAIQEQLQDFYQWANAMDNLAEVYEARGETAVARQLRQQTITRLQSLPPTTQIQALLAKLDA
ncbi:MAG: tetratricopeptide repeat protein [Chloroflexi bacterium]|nr:tetratricopeptide repeat protein [Chloroflexota bacterium]